MEEKIKFIIDEIIGHVHTIEALPLTNSQKNKGIKEIKKIHHFKLVEVFNLSEEDWKMKISLLKIEAQNSLGYGYQTKIYKHLGFTKNLISRFFCGKVVPKLDKYLLIKKAIKKLKK